VILRHLHAFWNDLWPNTIAPSAWTLAAVGVSHLKRTRQAERHHQEMKEHLAAAQLTREGG
jgi:hypothetical protein